MPRRSAGGADESPAPRRTSSRIASQVSKSPATPSSVKKSASKRTSKKIAEEATSPCPQVRQIDTNGAVIPIVLHSGDQETSEPSVKQQKIDDVVLTQTEDIKVDTPMEATTIDESKESAKIETRTEESETGQIEQVFRTDDETGFEIIEKDSVPRVDSEEVREALTAQGADGHLLVNFVQVSKDELPVVQPVTITDSEVVCMEKTTTESPSISCEVGIFPQETNRIIDDVEILPEVHQDLDVKNGDVALEVEMPDTVVVDSDSSSPQDVETV